MRQSRQSFEDSPEWLIFALSAKSVLLPIGLIGVEGGNDSVAVRAFDDFYLLPGTGLVRKYIALAHMVDSGDISAAVLIWANACILTLIAGRETYDFHRKLVASVAEKSIRSALEEFVVEFDMYRSRTFDPSAWSRR
jgi:hypothetical protein